MDDFWYDPVPGFEMPSSYVICQLCNGLGHTAIDCLSCYEPYDPVHTDPSFSVSDWLYPEQNESFDSNDSSSVIEEPLTYDNDVNESSPSPSPCFSTSNWYVDHLLDQLHCLQQLPTQSLLSYFSEANSLSSALAMAEAPISENDLIKYIVDGLDAHYIKFINYYYFRQPSLSLNILYSHLFDFFGPKTASSPCPESSSPVSVVAPGPSQSSSLSCCVQVSQSVVPVLLGHQPTTPVQTGVPSATLHTLVVPSTLIQTESSPIVPVVATFIWSSKVGYFDFTQEKNDEDEYYALNSPKEWQYMPWYDHLYTMLLFNINWLLSVFPIGIIFVIFKLHLRTSDWLEGGYWTKESGVVGVVDKESGVIGVVSRQ